MSKGEVSILSLYATLETKLSQECIVQTFKSRTASDMDGTLHTDLAGLENIRGIKKVL